MTTIAQDYDSLLVNRLVQANFPVCDKHKYNKYNRICGANKPIGFAIGRNLKANTLIPNRTKYIVIGGGSDENNMANLTPIMKAMGLSMTLLVFAILLLK